MSESPAFGADSSGGSFEMPRRPTPSFPQRNPTVRPLFTAFEVPAITAFPPQHRIGRTGVRLPAPQDAPTPRPATHRPFTSDIEVKSDEVQEDTVMDLPWRRHVVEGVVYDLPSWAGALKKLGSRVVKVTDARSGTTVAIKQIPSPFDSVSTAACALKQLRIFSDIHHPNLAHMTEAFLSAPGSQSTDLYVVMKALPSNLKRVLASGQKLSIDHVRFIVYQLLLAVQALHEAGVQHNNVCPSNVLMNGDCTLVLTGFAAAEPLGVSHGLLSNNATCVNVDDTLRETMAFAAPPEVFLPSCCDVSPSATFGVGAGDVWAVGCVLSELLGPVRKLGFGGSPIEHLKAIQDVLGEVSEEDLSFVTSPRSRQFLQRLMLAPSPVCHAQLADRFSPDVDPLAVDLLSSMLRFNPLHRVSVAAALRHPFFAGIVTPPGPSPKQRRFDWSGIRPAVSTGSEMTVIPRGTLMPPAVSVLPSLDAGDGEDVDEPAVVALDSGYSASNSLDSSHFSFRDSPVDELMSPHSSIGPITPMSVVLSPGSLSFSTLSSPLHSRSSSAVASAPNAHMSSYGGDIASPASVLSHHWLASDPSPMSQSSGVSYVRRASVPSVASSATAMFDCGDVKDATADRFPCKDVTPISRQSFHLQPPVVLTSSTTFDLLRQCVENSVPSR